MSYALASEPIVQRTAEQVTFSYRHRLGADQAEVTVEWSSDLMVWNSGLLDLIGRMPDGFGLEIATWQLPLESRGFVRLRVVVVP